MTKVMTSLPTSLLIFLATEWMDMGKDTTAFRERFNAYKNGKSVSEIYDAGLPRYRNGKNSVIDTLDKDQLDTLHYIHDYYSNRGMSLQDIAGIAANMFKESSFRHNAKDGAGYHGYVQMSPDMQLAVKKAYGNLDPDTQLQFVLDQITGNSKVKGYTNGAGYKYGGYKTGGDAAEAFRSKFERNKAGRQQSRIDYGNQFYDYFNQRALKQAVGQQPQPIIAGPDAVAVRPTIPAEQAVPTYDTKISPYISGKPTVKLMPKIQLPDLMEMMEDSEWEPSIPGLKNGKLPGYKDGKIRHNVSHAKMNDDGTFTDDYTKLFEDMYVTPQKTDLKRGSYTLNNFPYYLQHRTDWMKPFMSSGTNEKGLELIHPEFDLLLGGRQLATMLPSLKTKPGLGNPRPQAIEDVWLRPAVYKKQEKVVPDIKNLIPEEDLKSQLGEYLGEGGEQVVYRSKYNPDRAIKIKSEIYESPTLDDLEFVVNRDLNINKLPGVEPIQYKGFSYQTNPIRTKNPQTGEIKLNLNEQFVPIYEQKIVTPSSKINTDAFNVNQEDLINTWLTDHGYVYNPNTGYYGVNGVQISDYGFNNFGVDSFGNIKLIDPMIQKFKDGKLPGYKDGKIYIKPANRGKFTALKKRTGHSASWFKENGTPAQKKMAVFALNAKKWKH